MFSPSSPASSPLAHLGSRSTTLRPQLFHPTHSSPLSGSSSPTHAASARRKRQYKSHESSRIAAAPNLLTAFEDTPQRQFLRDRFRARCYERAKEQRARNVKRSRSSSVGSSSDGFDGDGDYEMDDDDDNLDDELYRRVMMNEERRAQHAKRVSFERDFGSSIDPSMYEDMETLEWELTGKASSQYPPPPPEEDYSEDALIQEYLAELEESERKNLQDVFAHIPLGGVSEVQEEDPGDLEREFMSGNEPQQPSPTRSMFSDFQLSSPPSSPSGSASASTSFPQFSTWKCPFCSNSIPRTHIACSGCAAQYPIDHARLAWIDPESHPDTRQGDHVPLATRTPNESGVGVVMLCAAPGCDWCFAF